MHSVIRKLNRDDMFLNIKDSFRKEWYVKPIKKKDTMRMKDSGSFKRLKTSLVSRGAWLGSS